MSTIESRLQRALDAVARYAALGAAIAVEIAGERHATIGAGFRDVDRSAAFQPDLLYQIGSQTKMFVAGGILLLVKDGALALEDDLNHVLPEALALTGGQPITIEQLLTHSSGLGNYTELMTLRGGFMAGWPVPTYTDDDLFALSKAMGFAFLPGRDVAYSNTGFILLGRIIERLSGEASTAFLKRRLLDPLGMSDTYFARGGVWPRERTATGGIIRPASPLGETVQADDPPDLSWASSAGDIISSLDQLLRFANVLMSRNSPLPIGLADFMARPVPLTAPWVNSDLVRTYGYGMVEVDFNGRAWWGHRGGTATHRTGTFCCPELDASIAMATTCIVDPRIPAKSEAVRDHIRLTLSLAAYEVERIVESKA